MVLGCGCATQSLVPRIEITDPTDPNYPYLYPSVDRNGVFTLDADLMRQLESDWAGTAGNGIAVTTGGDTGHTPTIAVCVDPASEVPLSFVNVAGSMCLTATASNAAETAWTSPNIVAAGGIVVTAAGTNGHNPAFGIEIADGAPFEINATGGLDFTGDLTGFSCSDLNGCSISALADVELDGNQGTGHVLVFDTNGVLVNQPAQNVVAEAIVGVAGAVIPAPPTVGAPVTLQWDPVAQTYSWV